MTVIQMIFNRKSIIFDSVGFDSMSDFMHNILATKWIFAMAGIFAAIITSIDTFIEINVFSPSRGIWILFAATIFDIILGISVAFKEKSLDAGKFNRAWIRFVVQVIIIGLLNQSNIVWEMVNDWIVNTLLLAFVLTTIWSSFKNAYKLRWIQPDTFLALQRIFGAEEAFKEFIKQMFNNDKKK